VENIIVSPKHSSLAFDEVKEQNQELDLDTYHKPELNVLVNPRYMASSSFEQEILKIEGKLTVSF
jgi:hypothetical protein